MYLDRLLQCHRHWLHCYTIHLPFSSRVGVRPLGTNAKVLKSITTIMLPLVYLLSSTIRVMQFPGWEPGSC
jgi:hypothetical protein